MVAFTSYNIEWDFKNLSVREIDSSSSKEAAAAMTRTIITAADSRNNVDRFSYLPVMIIIFVVVVAFYSAPISLSV
jgi:hypothetical protein